MMVMGEETRQDESAASQETSGQMDYERIERPGKNR